MKYQIILGFILCIIVQCSLIHAQDTFIKKIDKEETIRARQIIKYEERLFILNTGVCNQMSECCTVMEIDEFGNVIWERRLPWLDVVSRSMVIENDTIYLSGNYNQTQQKFLFHQMSIDGGDSLTTYNVVKPDDIYTDMFNLGMLKIDNMFYIYGAGEKEDGLVEYSLIYIVDRQGNLDTLLSLFPSDRTSAIWQMREDNQGNAVAYMLLDSLGFLPGKEDVRRIIKLNNKHEIIWSYTSEEVHNDFVTPKGVILDDDRIVYVTANESNNMRLHALRAINPDSTISWQYNSPEHPSNHRVIRRIKKAKDGNIFGFGEWGFKIYDPKIDDVPWIFKISTEGKMLWEQVYYEMKEDGSEAKTGEFFDAVELDDGSIMAVGGMRSDNNDILIARFDSEGCLIMDCIFPNDVTVVLSDVEDVEVEIGISVYPNPSTYGEAISIAIDVLQFAEGRYSIELHNALGEQVRSEKMLTADHRLDMDALLQGMYFLIVRRDNRIVHSEKVVRW